MQASGATSQRARIGDVELEAPDERGHVHPLGRPIGLRGPPEGVVKVFRALASVCCTDATVDFLDLNEPSWCWRDEASGTRHGPFSGAQLCSSVQELPTPLQVL